MAFELDWPSASIVRLKRDVCGEGDEDLLALRAMYEAFVRRFEEDLDVTLHPRVRRGLWKIFNDFRSRVVSTIDFYKDPESSGCLRDVRSVMERYERVLEEYELENGLRKRRERGGGPGPRR